jgi:HK97 family phage portal protein
VLAEGVASLPCITYKRLPRGGKERAAEHPNYRLLRTEPNPESTAYQFWETLIFHWSLYGNAFAEVVRDGSGRPIALYPLDSRYMQVDRDQGGKLVYVYRDGKGEAVLKPEDVLHVAGLSADGSVGYSLLRTARNALKLTEATEEFGRSFFGNCSRPSGLLKTEGVLSDQARENLRRSWEALHSSSSNTGKVAILEEGLDFSPIQLTNEEGQYKETRQFQILEVCRLFNVPPHRVRALDRATWGNIEAENISFVTDTLRPILVRFEQEVNRKLFLPSEQDTYFAEWLVDSLLRGDTASRFNVYAVALQSKILSVNECREMENRNPIEDPEFDKPGIPPGQQPEADPADEGTEGEQLPDEDQGDEEQPGEEEE